MLAAGASARFYILPFCRGKKTTTTCWRKKQKWLLFCRSSDLEDPCVHISFSCNVKHCPLAQSPSQLCELTVESFCKATASRRRCLKISLLPVLVSKSWSLALVTISYFLCLFGGMSWLCFHSQGPSFFPCFFTFYAFSDYSLKAWDLRRFQCAGYCEGVFRKMKGRFDWKEAEFWGASPAVQSLRLWAFTAGEQDIGSVPGREAKIPRAMLLGQKKKRKRNRIMR